MSPRVAVFEVYFPTAKKYNKDTSYGTCRAENSQRTYNDKAYTYPHLFGQFFNFRIFIKFFIHEVKKNIKVLGIGAVFA